LAASLAVAVGGVRGQAPDKALEKTPVSPAPVVPRSRTDLPVPAGPGLTLGKGLPDVREGPQPYPDNPPLPPLPSPHPPPGPACLLGLQGAVPLSAEEAALPGPTGGQPGPVVGLVQTSEAPVLTAAETGPAEAHPWQTVWGLGGLRVIAEGPKVAPNGQEYHPCFSIDLDVNCWVWRSQGLYLFGDSRFWGEKPENGVTNGRDGGLGFSKRQFDLLGGAAWNYAGPWEARVFGYSLNNLNRGQSLLTPAGINDGFGLENRFYLAPEYAKLGQTGFDVARATFLSVGYYPTKEMVGNDGQLFKPGVLLRAYLTYDLWSWPAYAFGDATFISERSLQPKLLLFDVGLAARPFGSWQQWEFRLGVENTADFQVGNVLNLWYASLRYVF
jgi:hypothetical protein